tara:strand:- start:146 stop:895 length:750 start_codon:yes stop_codon:yes gene_type:complete
MGRLNGKVALISGGSMGQGREEVSLFCEEGAKVVFGDIRDKEGYLLEKELRVQGFDVTYFHLDVTKESDWKNAVAKTVELHTNLDILINNAGIYFRKGLEETTEEEWDYVHNINSKGVFLGAKSVISAMKKSGGGSIVNISSMAGLIGSQALAYGASKGAVRLLSKSIAVQYGTDGIRCNSVHPGIIEDTYIVDNFLPEDLREDFLENTPLKIFGNPRDVALGVLFLASDESSYITGSELVMDGGMTAK